MERERQRYFFGIDLPDDVKEKVYKEFSFLEEERSARLVRPENLHVTVGFLGHLYEQDARRILEEYTRIVENKSVERFVMHIRGWGVFPPSGLPRVLWIGINSGRKELSMLHELLREATRVAGIETHLDTENRPFSPHLTVARFSRINPREWLKTKNILERVNASFGDVIVDKVVLKRSVLSRTGPTYHDEGVVVLG